MAKLARGATLGLLISALLAACAGGTASRRDPITCEGGAARPISLATLREVFEAAGLPLYPDPDCNIRGLVAQASTVVQSGPHKNVERQAEIIARYGMIFCGLRDSSHHFAIGEVEKVKHATDQETSFYFENVGCAIYPDPRYERRQVAKLARVMADLAAAQRQRS